MAILQRTSKQVTPEQVAGLRTQVEGEVIAPGDAGYDQARMPWNLAVQQHPALILVAASASDIAAGIRFAQENDLGIAIQATGHGVRRPADDCLLVVTSRMTGATVNAEAQTAWVEAGAKWGVVLEQAQAAGLAPLLGSSPDVGAVGYTLGGGMGWLVRRYGLSSDSVRRFEVVTADGRILNVSATENADLFWGLRGGGGSLAIVTGMEIQLYPVTTVYGGNLYYPGGLAREVMGRYRDWIADAPDELTSSVIIMNYPPIPEVPEFLRGQSLVQVRGCYCGPVEEGEALMRPWREWHAPMVDDFKEMPFSQVALISNDPPDPMPGHATSAWLHALDDATIDTLIRHVFVAGGPPPIVFAEIRHAAGQIAAVDPASSAYSHRQNALILEMVGMTPTPEAHHALIQTYAQVMDDLKPALTGHVYINFLEGEESLARTRDAYSAETYQRLTQLKATHDPDNRLGYSFDIPPAAGSDR